MKYVNEYTMGTAATVATTGLAYYLSPTATLTFTSIAGLATLSLAAVVGSYAAFLGAKAAYSYFLGDETATSEAKKDDKPAPRRSPRLNPELAKKQQEEEAKKNAPSMLKNGVTAVSNAASNVTTGISTRLSNAVGAVKNWWKGEEAAKPAAKEEAAKPAAKKEAAKPAAKKEAAKPVTHAYAAKKQAAKKGAVVEMAINNRPKRNVAPIVRFK